MAIPFPVTLGKTTPDEWLSLFRSENQASEDVKSARIVSRVQRLPGRAGMIQRKVGAVIPDRKGGRRGGWRRPSPLRSGYCPAAQLEIPEALQVTASHRGCPAPPYITGLNARLILKRPMKVARVRSLIPPDYGPAFGAGRVPIVPPCRNSLTGSPSRIGSPDQTFGRWRLKPSTRPRRKLSRGQRPFFIDFDRVFRLPNLHVPHRGAVARDASHSGRTFPVRNLLPLDSEEMWPLASRFEAPPSRVLPHFRSIASPQGRAEIVGRHWANPFGLEGSVTNGISFPPSATSQGFGRINSNHGTVFAGIERRPGRPTCKPGGRKLPPCQSTGGRASILRFPAEAHCATRLARPRQSNTTDVRWRYFSSPPPPQTNGPRAVEIFPGGPQLPLQGMIVQRALPYFFKKATESRTPGLRRRPGAQTVFFFFCNEKLNHQC